MRVAAAVAVVIVLAAPGCGDPSGPPPQTIHAGPVVTDETWTRAESPHIVRGPVFISNDAILTIEAGATVLFDSLSSLTFGYTSPGTLRALGTDAQPITMRSLDTTASPGFWGRLALRSNTASEMHYVELSGCGFRAFLDSLPAGCIVLGNPFLSENPNLLIDHVTVRDARGGAVILSGKSHITGGSTHLSVLNMRGYIASMRARESATFPLGGRFGGNDSNEVRLTLDTLRDSLTWGGGVPWLVTDKIFVEGPKQPVLTIPPDATVQMKGALAIGTTESGGLQVGSESGQTVTLTAADTSWDGIYFGPYTVSSSLTHVILEKCGRVENSSFPSDCVLISGLYTETPPFPAPVLKHVTIRNAGFNVGLGLTFRARLGSGSTDLTITGTGTPISIGGGSPSSIPPGNYTGNLRDVIEITDGRVWQDETWPNFALPYFVTSYMIDSLGGVSVGAPTTHPTLTLLPGTTIEFAAGARLWVGWEGPGAVKVVGTVLQPIRLLGQGGTPGSWVGIQIGYNADSSTIFDHVIVDGAGEQFPVAGSFHFYVDVGPIIRNTVISNSSGCGIIIVNQPPWNTDFTDPALGNTFTNNAGGAVCGP
ncbi:MAG TPA: hypothetical protein VGJ80_13680 [Gemmatimonadales bacterium]|jgi:hypothetical protein